MKIKICGMRNPQNIREITALEPDYLGFIFYEKSPRYVLNDLDFQLSGIDFQHTKKVGVFVNEHVEKIRETAKKYHLDALQLHGNETPLQCIQLQDEFTVIKAFPIAEAADFIRTADYEGCCDYFLFDTKTLNHGGSGQKFDWKILDTYKGKTSFFLSGGISPNDAEHIKEIHHPKLYGIDMNSRFERTAGLKNVALVEQFIKQLNHEQD